MNGKSVIEIAVKRLEQAGIPPTDNAIVAAIGKLTDADLETNEEAHYRIAMQAFAGGGHA